MSTAGRRPTALSAITLATHDMARAVKFYRDLGFEIKYGGEREAFTSFYCGPSFVNLILVDVTRAWSWWGRVIFYVDDVDACHANAVAHGYAPEALPRNAAWGERYFHITDPDGHELSFACPLAA